MYSTNYRRRATGRKGRRVQGHCTLCATNLSKGPSSIAFIFPAQARSVPPPPRQICSKISGLEAKFVPYFHVCPYFALMRPLPLLSRPLALPPRCRPIFEASHFCPTASTSSSPGRFGGCERGERVREWTGARWHGGQESRDAPHYHRQLGIPISYYEYWRRGGGERAQGKGRQSFH